MQEDYQYKKITQENLYSKCCEICYLYYDEKQNKNGKPDKICYKCWQQHVKTYLTQISYKVGSQVISPFQGESSIDVCIALQSLQKNDMIQLEEWLFKKYSSFTPDIQKCPSQTCNYIFTMQKCGGWNNNSSQKCPKCEMVLIQSTTFNINNIIGFIYFLFLANKCPKCQIPIEKTTGCPHMSCPCGHHFCWYCLKDYFHGPNNLYSVHDAKECIFIFLSRIFFKIILLMGLLFTFLGNQVFQDFISYLFVGLKYTGLTIIVDLIIIIDVVLINHIWQRYNNKYYYSQKQSRKCVIFLLLLILGNVSIGYGASLLSILYTCAIILIIQLTIAGIGSGLVFLIMFSIQTWFEFIC